MQTSVIGYPRVGSLRELKFATEKYFKNDITQEALLEQAKTLRAEHLKSMKESGIDFIPVNDFSFYDGMLDTVVLLNTIPARYCKLNVSELDTYFAMARGYQKDGKDVKALAMKKWFNTNYHYMVPEIEDDADIRLAGKKPFDEFKEALTCGVVAKPVLIGPFTFLKLARYTGTKSAADFADACAAAYSEALKKFANLGAKWVQFDEPALVYDLTAEEIALFEKLYRVILAAKGSAKVLLQTYFGDIRDAYDTVTKLGFDGIGIDFLEGKKSFELVSTKGFPAQTVLFAGLVNGKNIWKNHYRKTIDRLNELSAFAKEIVLSTSCSLLHVPYTLENETKLPEAYKKHFAFAREKLAELSDLAKIVANGDREVLAANDALFATARPDCENAAVRTRLQAVSEADFERKPAFAEREKIQKEALALPQFPTTTIGSFPQTADVKANRKAFKAGQISEEEYKKFNQEKIRECVKLQEELDLDVLVHGEYERNDMVEYFGEQLSGYLFTEKAWVQSYGTRCVKPPIVWGDISREKPMTVEWSVFAKSCTNRPMKGMLTGPVTILNWSFPREDISHKESALQIALAIRDEVLDLEAAGINIIQIDEAALREKLPLRKSDWYSEYLDWAIPAFRLVHSGVKASTQIHTHMCYSEFTDIIPTIDNMDADVITFEASRSDLLILDALRANNFKTEVGPGVYDIHSPRVPSEEEIVNALSRMLARINPEKLWVNPDCGLKTRGTTETVASLQNMVAAAKRLRANNE
ncbi:MAG: 5-methyltetrahydropteroyltriglutamate--homocysteine S-methyltransferase [Lachnospiraceae bacterium]|nr:5-methyltetrahydropteroyltriglutamate--homocysteine S-methyltransferase [Lachnospiraceae bacterium]